MRNSTTAIVIVVAAAAWGFGEWAAAHTPRPFSSGQGQVMWDLETPGYPADNTIRYRINPTRPAGYEILPVGTTEEDIVAAIRSVFQAYENIPTSSLKFEFLGVDHEAVFAEDGVLLVTLDFNDPGVECEGSNYKRITIAPDAPTHTFADTGETVAIETPFTVIDYDIALCGEVFSLNAAEDTLDVAGLLTHELGHMFGLGHSILQPTSMSGYRASMAATMRTLSTDDMLGISVLYPAPDFYGTTGTLDGVVVEVDENGEVIGEVFGAHITIVDAATGRAVTESVTGVSAVDPTTGRAIKWDKSKKSGRYVISGLPPGGYQVRVDAYDGPAVVGSGKIINMGFFDDDEIGPRRDFAYVLDATVYTVAAKQTTIVNDLEAGPFNPDFPNVDSRVLGLVDGTWSAPAVAMRGQTTTIAIAIGINAGPDDSFWIDGTDAVQLIDPRVSGSGTSLLVDAVIAADAPLGAYNIMVGNDHGFSMVHGGLVISSGPPIIESIEPRCATAGEAIEIHGEHFTFDSQVYFDGLLASDLVVVSPTLITAVVPEGREASDAASILSDTGSSDLPAVILSDLDANGAVGPSDLAVVLAGWGPCPPEPSCAGDIDCDGLVDAVDLSRILADWG